jgi:hypothetical protein
MFDSPNPNLVEVWTCEVGADLTLQAESRDALIHAIMAWLMSEEILAQPFGYQKLASAVGPESGAST